MTLLTLPPNLELPVLQPPRKHYGFSKDNPPPGLGRKKGSINKITRDLKEGVMAGAAACGYDGNGLGGVDGFLLYCAQRHPKHYLALMGKLLPYNITANSDVATVATTAINFISVPHDHYLSAEDIAKSRAEPVPAQIACPAGELIGFEELASAEEPQEPQSGEAQLVELSAAIKDLARQVGVSIDDL